MISKKAIYLFMLLIGLVTIAIAQPISENFDGAWPPPGWNVDSTTRETTPFVTPVSTPYCVYFNQYTDWLRTPFLPSPGILSFYHKRRTVDTDFWIQVGPTTSGPWTNVVHLWAGYNWTPAVVDLNGYTNVYVRFALQSGLDPDCVVEKYMFIDGVSVDRHVPVELSSFTATLLEQQNEDIVQLRWVTQSETQVSGYNIYRNNISNVENATQINLAMIEAANTSQTSNYTFSDTEIEPGTLYYWLQSNDMNGTTHMYGPISITVGSGYNPDQSLGLGVNTMLNDSYPNPFNLKTSIPFQITTKADVKIEIFNQKGQLVWSYTKGSADIGMYKIDWNGRDQNGKKLSSGVYYCRMSTDNYLGVKKLFYKK